MDFRRKKRKMPAIKTSGEAVSDNAILMGLQIMYGRYRMSIWYF